MYIQYLRGIKIIAEIASFYAGIVIKPSIRNKYLYNRKLYKTSLKTREFIEATQLQKLNDLLSYANRHVSYYHQLFRSLGLVAKREEDVALGKLGELKLIPILDKSTIRREGAALYSDQTSQREAYTNTSGGSTGEKAVFLQDGVFGQTTSANFMFARGLMGIPAWAKNNVLLWAADRDIGSPSIPSGKLTNIFRNSIVLNSCKMRPEEMRRTLEAIELKCPHFIRGYAQSLFELAKFARSEKIKISPQKAVISTATTLSADMREIIQKVFGCKVFDYYGSREVGPVATECFAHDGLHVLEDNNVVELLNNSGRDAKLGEVGDIVLTNLNNYSMPLIRFRVGDSAYVHPSSVTCLCGCNYAKIGQLLGRTSDVFRLANGDIVDGTYLTTVLNSVDSIERFQIIQQTYDHLELVIQAPSAIEHSLTNKIEMKLRESMGKECFITWRYVDVIEPGPTGKYRYVISKIEEEKEPKTGASV